MSFDYKPHAPEKVDKDLLVRREAMYTDQGLHRHPGIIERFVGVLDILLDTGLCETKVSYGTECVVTESDASVVECLQSGVESILITDVTVRHAKYWNAPWLREDYLVTVGISDTFGFAHKTSACLQRYPNYDSAQVLSSTAIRWAVANDVPVEQACNDWTAASAHDLSDMTRDLKSFQVNLEKGYNPYLQLPHNWE